MEKAQIRSKKLNAALFQFVFPFSTKPDSQKAFKLQLGEDGYRPFRLSDMDQQDLYYGEKYRVSHRTMERYYLPFTANVLFPHEEDAESFQRYSKSLDLHCLLKTKFVNIPFRILSADVILCPFDLGFITVRTEMTDSSVDFTEALEFANRFRVLQDIDEQDDMTFVVHEDKEYEEVEEFIFKIVAASILPFLDTSQMEGAYFETMPFFVDERMYVQSFYGFEEGEELHKEDLYRAARIDGMTEKGDPYLSASSPDYIEWYCRDHTYNRWAPNTFYVTDENSFSCLTNLPKERAVGMANQMYGEYYYGLLLNLFHKIVLLKLSNRYSQVRVEKNKEEIEDLIGSITMFSAKYFFLELVTQSQEGRSSSGCGTGSATASSTRMSRKR
ncbi:hypothetical protein N6H14_18440 [Paenibacillus sp. CC-CFT747]|nr:hypothetical protein N6H14_18440 [Paenibacillus sp. CC-CFT747]